MIKGKVKSPNELIDIDIAIIKSLYNNSGIVRLVAKSMFMNKSNVYYHLSKIRRITGINPLTYAGRKKLFNMVNEERILNK